MTAAVTLALCTSSAAAQSGLQWAGFEPIAISPTRPPDQPVTLRVGAIPGTTAVQLRYAGGGTLTLRDDGIAPDRVAGDRVFSAHVPTPSILSRNVEERRGRPFLGMLKTFAGSVARPLESNLVAEVASPDQRAYAVTRSVNPMPHARTSHVINIIDPVYHQSRSAQTAIRSALQIAGDRFDFVDVVSVERAYFENRYHQVVRNDVEGIGLNKFDNSAAFGSTRRLLGYSHFPILSYYDPLDEAYSHEIGHQWVNHLKGPLADIGVHWGVGPNAHHLMGMSDDSRQGVRLSCRLERVGGVVTGTREEAPSSFSAYDLYLMGLIDGSELPASWQFANQSMARQRVLRADWCTGPIDLATLDVTLDTVVAHNGPRVPAQGQRYFKSLLVAVSAKRLLDDDELRYLTWLAERGDRDVPATTISGFWTGTGTNFQLRTGGRARIDHRIDAVFRSEFEH